MRIYELDYIGIEIQEYLRRCKMSKTKVIKCDCTNEYQDSKYGKGMRVFNELSRPTPEYRCTVCVKEVRSTK